MLMFGQDLVGSGLNPGQISGLSAWYDFTQAAYLTLASTAITQALDRSGNGNNTAVQGTGTARFTWTANQVNGLSAAVGDGGDTLALPAALYSIPNGANTMFVVSKRASEDGTEDMMVCMTEGGSANTRFVMSFQTIAGSIAFKSNASTGAVTSTGNTNTNFQISTAFRSGTTQSLSINGGTASTNTNGANENGVDAAFIGSNAGSTNFLIGSIAEILIYNRALTGAEITQVGRYLSNKYAIPLV